MKSHLYLLALCALWGCRAGTGQGPQPLPRPVSVLTLSESDPARVDRITGTVASWKTDDIGFEVAGRVEYVIEPDQHIEGKVHDAQGELLTSGDALARIDATRYLLNAEAVRAQIRTVQKQRDAAEIELTQVMPARKTAAAAERDLAQTEVERNERLVAENAAPQRALDLERSKLETAKANLAQLEASEEAKRAEIASLEAQIEQLQQSLKEAERDVEDCELFSPFPGQIAKVHMIPGSFAERGQPVVTVQMMNPMKVEFEVSPARARNLGYQEQVRILVPRGDGTLLPAVGFIYTIDPVADPQTRTFTVTLLSRNELVPSRVPDELNDQPVPRTDLISKVFDEFVAEHGALFVNEEAIQKDAQGSFLWRILNRQLGTLTGDTSQLLRVEKVRIKPGEMHFSTLGIAMLQSMQFDEGQDFDTQRDLIVGRVERPQGMTEPGEPFEGDTMLYYRERWLLRPGDLVSVDLRGGESAPGLYVPLDAIMEKSGIHFVFAVQQGEQGDTARRVEVTVHDRVGTLQRIEAVDDTSLRPGAKIVAGGAAFLADGEPLNVVEDVDVLR